MSYMSRTDSTRGAEARKAEAAIARGSKSSSKHKGVSWDKGSGKWLAQIMRNSVTQILGRFAEEEEAAAAYRAADAAFEISASEITSLLSRTRTLDAQWDPKDSRCMIHKYGSKVCMKEVCMKEGEEGEEPGITRCMNHKSRAMIGTNRDTGHVVLEGDPLPAKFDSWVRQGQIVDWPPGQARDIVSEGSEVFVLDEDIPSGIGAAPRLSAVMQDRGSVVQREWGNHARKRWLDKLRATNEECWAEVTVENQTRAFYTASLLKAGWLTRKPSPP